MNADEYRESFTVDLLAADLLRARSQQNEARRIGISEVGVCHERMRLTLSGAEHTDSPSSLAAMVGTWIHEGVESYRRVNRPDLIHNAQVTVTLPNGMVLHGHPDEIDPTEPSITDLKSANGLGAVRRLGADEQQRYQRHCLDPDTPVLLSDLTWTRIADLAPGNQLLSVDDDPVDQGGGRKLRYWRHAEVQAVWMTRKPAYELTLNDGTVLTAGQGHRFLSRNKSSNNWRWRTVDSIAATVARSGPLRIARPYSPASEIKRSSECYRAGYIAGATLGDGCARVGVYRQNSYWNLAQQIADSAVLDRVREYAGTFGVKLTDYTIRVPDVGWQRKPMQGLRSSNRPDVTRLVALADREQTPDWKCGWLAGLYDTDGTLDRRGKPIFVQKDRSVLLTAQMYLKELGFTAKIREPNLLCLTGPVTSAAQFLALIRPALTRKMEWLAGRSMRDFSGSVVVSARAVGDRDLVDISTSTGTFIANGVISHNCYYEGARQAGLVPDRGIVRNVWIDRSGKDPVPHVEQEPFDPAVVAQAGLWLEDVAYAVRHSEEASKDKPRSWCRVACPFYTGCRGGEMNLDVLPERYRELVVLYHEAQEQSRGSSALKEELRDELAGITGTVGDLAVISTVVNAKVPYVRVETRRIA